MNRQDFRISYFKLIMSGSIAGSILKNFGDLLRSKVDQDFQFLSRCVGFNYQIELVNGTYMLKQVFLFFIQISKSIKQNVYDIMVEVKRMWYLPIISPRSSNKICRDDVIHKKK